MSSPALPLSSSRAVYRKKGRGRPSRREREEEREENLKKGGILKWFKKKPPCLLSSTL
jgi:hypothetical protein